MTKAVHHEQSSVSRLPPKGTHLPAAADCRSNRKHEDQMEKAKKSANERLAYERLLKVMDEAFNRRGW